MSALPMYRTCVKCWKTYSCNPSIGDLGNVCPYCHAPQTTIEIIKCVIDFLNKR